MYDKTGLTLKDIVAKLNDVVNKVPDDTEVYITFRQFDSDYQINEVRLVGLDIATDDDDEKKGCPACIEFISDDVVEESDIYTALECINDEEFIVDYAERHGGIIQTIIDRYGNPRY